MRNTTLLGAAALLISAPLLLSNMRPADKVGEGDKAPELAARTWFNHLGNSPELENLAGRPVFIEFWATW